ncbi:TonB-dependent receptor [Terrimonas sp.]|uniref:SusC/RagA family TonB-linked outer membrane protein n=1 Tax=Terrimonas sp. TaxID=1914338 RepID=UPI000D5154F2|nr:TonB-dependent receptor [Terrimonas sp.]PVD51898.1 TonB-dependent receptor [Terrimonas sp.]
MKIKFWLLFSLLGSSLFIAQAQQGTIINSILEGQVTDKSNNAPLEGVSIVIKGTTNQTLTNSKGQFILRTGQKLPYTLLVTIVGYKSTEIKVDSSPVKIELEQDVQSLSDIVVVGYGTQKRKDLTGSVSSISAKDFNKGSNVSVDNLIAGRAAGVQVTQSSSEPGAGVSIRIRGANSINASNEPLYVIDGFPIDNSNRTPTSAVVTESAPRNPLNSLNPSDIASVEILKDASATAIYGSRGANGVILITTKRGKRGRLSVEYNVSGAVQEVAKKIPVLSTSQYISLLNDLKAAQGLAPEFTDEDIAAIGKGVNWQDEIFRKGYTQNHQLSFSGGQDKFTYYASLNYLDQTGIVISSGIKRYTGRVNLNYTDAKFKFGINLNTAKINDDYVPNGVSINEGAGIVNAAIFQDPTLGIYDKNTGKYAQTNLVNLENPLGLAYGVSDYAVTSRTFGNAFLEYFIIPEFSVKINGGTDIQSSRRDTYLGRNTRKGNNANGIASVQTTNSNNALLELTARYAKTFSNHSLEVLGGYTWQNFGWNTLNSGAQNFTTDAFGTDNMAAGSSSTFTINTYKSRNQLQSLLGRINYTFNDKYLLTANFRADGSSRFGADNKYGYFPSLALGWHVNRENFFRNVRTISTLKLRASYGRTGNQEIGNYRSLVLLGTQGQAVFGNAAEVGISTTQLANPNLKWETTSQFDAGVDFGLLDDRITGSIDYFNKNTKDLLLELPVPATTGFATTLTNIGSMNNSGFEFTVNTVNLRGKFNWTTSANLSVVRNKVTGIGGLPDILQGSAGFFNSFSILKVGQPLNSFYGYEVVGVLQKDEQYTPQPLSAPGDLKFLDANDDKTISASDRKILGSSFPDFTYGINNSLGYGRFNLSFFWQGVKGGKILNLNISESENPISFRRNRLSRSYTDRWTETNPTNENPSGLSPAFAYVDASGTINSRAVQSASFLRLKNISLSYDIPANRVFQSAQVYFVAQNLVTFSNYFGFDPEVTAFGTSNVRVDYNAYPLSKIYTLGLNVKF